MSGGDVMGGQLGLGWLRSHERMEDYGSILRTFAAGPVIDPPSIIDHRKWLATENQGGVGSCAGHAGADCAQVCNWIATHGEAVRMSRMWCYLMGQKQSGLFGRDVGATISGVVSAMNQFGVPREATFPYPGAYRTQIPAAAFTEAKEHRILSASPMRSYDECFAFLASGIGAIQIGIDWTSSLAGCRDGVIERVSGGSYGGHSVSLVGYSARRDSQDRQYLWLHNSHGTGWGNEGWGEVAPRVIDAWIEKSGVGEFMGLSDMEAYERRWIDVSLFA